jgi:GT2 family glycosyltransferase
MSSNEVCIGIPVREHPEWTALTLAHLRACTREAAVVLLADGLDVASRSALEQLGVRVVTWERTMGNAACFNWLVRNNEADLYVLLENGARVAPSWLERIEEALDCDPAYGLAGPSTNRAWNEQQFHPACTGEAEDLARTAELARSQFGAANSTLGPLHSLCDFCFAVSRKVVEQIGAADEGYADGPCWEMEYSARALRAGFAGLWAKSAFVWRAPDTARRRATESRRFEFNKRRYQNQLCALKLQKKSAHYDAHCIGESCEHFAPRELITIYRAFSPPSLPCPAIVSPAPPPVVTASPHPLVSCIMPTANRRAYVSRAIEAFLNQDYEPRELVILDDGADCVADLVPQDPRIHYFRCSGHPSLGSKRNEACRLAQGGIIVHWDDDDWHARWRLSYQVDELQRYDADICGLDRIWFYDEGNRRAWQYRYPGGRARWLAGGSFCYRRALWEKLRFSDVSVGEDTRFVRKDSFALAW